MCTAEPTESGPASTLRSAGPVPAPLGASGQVLGPFGKRGREGPCLDFPKSLRRGPRALGSAGTSSGTRRKRGTWAWVRPASPLGAAQRKAHCAVAREGPGQVGGRRGLPWSGRGARTPSREDCKFNLSNGFGLHPCPYSPLRLISPSHPTGGLQMGFLRMGLLWASAPGTGPGSAPAPGGRSLKVRAGTGGPQLLALGSPAGGRQSRRSGSSSGSHR